LLLCLGLAAPVVGQEAVEQEDNPAGIEEIVVTGSRIPRSDLSSISPISVLSEEDLEAAGNPTLEDFLQDLPAVGGGDFGSSVNNGNPGLATASLRGLGPNRTLVLLNGHRPAPYGTGGLVDLNLIPTSMIERVEVLRDGASAIYGSDAIAGVINIITKRDFSGIDLDLGYDTTGEWDGDQQSLALTLGQASERGHWVLNGQWTKREEIWQRDRDFSACPYGESGMPRTRNCIGSGTAYPARITVGNDRFVVDSDTGQVRAFGDADTYNYAAVSYMVTPQEIFSLYGDARYNLTEGGWSDASIFLRGNFANRSSDQLLAPVGTFWGPRISRLHPNNPFGDALCDSTTQCSTPQDVVITRRLAESGGRGFTQSATSWQLIAGLDGKFANGWRWDVSFDYAKFDDGQRDPGRAVRPRLELLLTPDDPGTMEVEGCAGDSDCSEAAGSAGVWNPFARDTLTSAMQGYSLVAPNEIHRSILQVFQFNLQGDLGGLELPGGPVQWAFGYEKRREQSQVLPDAGALLDQIYFVTGEETRGAYAVEELYGELRLPLLADAAWAKALTLELSARRSDYTTIGTGTTFKLAFEYAPSEDLRFRVVSSDGFRAPSISELFAPQQLTAAQYNEPCLNWGMNDDPVIRDNCEAEGLPMDFSLSSTQATGIQGGNPDLKEETSDSLTVGIVFTPSFLPNLSVALDWYDIEIEDAIGSAGTDNIITGCWSSPGFSSSLCGLIDPRGAEAVGASRRMLPAGATAPNYRDALNTVAGQLLTQANLASFETNGVDFSIRYGWDLSVGRLDLSLTGTYLLGYEFTAFEGADTLDLAGKFGTDPYQGDTPAAFPDIQANLRIGLLRDNWNIAWTARFMSEVDDINARAANLENSADAIWYHDLQANYEWRNIVLTLGMRNLLDEEPPYVTNYDDMNTINYSYDTAGRYLYSRLNFRY